jgi:hypothetical protein
MTCIHCEDYSCSNCGYTTDIEILRYDNDYLKKENMEQSQKLISLRHIEKDKEQLEQVIEIIRKEKDSYINNMLETQFQNYQEIRKLKKRNAELENAIKDFNI